MLDLHLWQSQLEEWLYAFAMTRFTTSLGSKAGYPGSALPRRPKRQAVMVLRLMAILCICLLGARTDRPLAQSAKDRPPTVVVVEKPVVVEKQVILDLPS